MTTKVDLMINIDFVILQEQFKPCFYRRTVYHANHFNCLVCFLKKKKQKRLNQE